MTRIKDCGSCQFFVKLNSVFSGGLCEKLDARTKSDYGHKCKHWKAIPYDMKKKYHIIINKESNE